MLINYTMWSSNLFLHPGFSEFFIVQVFRVQIFQDPGFSGPRFFRVQVFQGPGFSESRFFCVQVFQGPGFSESRFFRVRVQGLGLGFRNNLKNVRFYL